MLDFDFLEKKCKKYRFKKFFKIFLLLTVVILIPIIVVNYNYFAFFQQESKVLKKVDTKSSLKIQKSEIETEKIKKIVKKESINKTNRDTKACYALQFLMSRTKFLPKINEIRKNLESSGFSSCYIKNGEDNDRVYLRCNRVKNLNELQKYKKIATELKLDFFVVRESCENIENKKVKIQIPKEKKIEVKKDSFVTVNEPTIEELKDLFNRQKRYTLAIKISKKYFEKKDYKNALYWAKEANRLDNEDEESWLLYAKSLYKLGDKDSARELLKVYLEFKRSKNALNLLKEWTKNDS